MSTRSRVLTIAAVTAALLAAPSVGEATPAGWTGPTLIAQTNSVVNQVFATAPNGADALVWAGPGTTVGKATLFSRLRLPGKTAWTTVPSHLANQYNIQEYTLRAAPNGDFWLAFVQYSQTTGFPEVYVMRLDHTTHRWTKKTQVFHSATYHHGGAQLAVAGDGTVVVGAYAPPVTPPLGNPGYRTVVAVKSPGTATWRATYLSPAGMHATTPGLAANRKGQLVASWIINYDSLSTMAVRAAVRNTGPHALWKATTLTVPGASQRSYVAIGDNGTAAVVWVEPASGSSTAIGAGTLKVGGGATSWLVTSPVSGGGLSSPAVTVGHTGIPTVVYRQSGTAGAVMTQATTFVTGSWTVPAVLTPTDELSQPDALVTRTNGKAVVLYQQFAPGTIADLGLRIQTLSPSGNGAPQTVTTSGDPRVNAPYLGVTAAGGTAVEWQSGPYPGNHQAWSGSMLRAPSVLANAFTTKRVKHTVVKGKRVVGKTVTCSSGYWVEAGKLLYSWSRGGAVIHGAHGQRYVLTAADHGHKVACSVTASNRSTHKTVLRGRGVFVH